ncbi:hypothetical protein Cgig2_025137 [Carnegiea gigantea]|uniref:Nuclear matrix constituent protein 1-like protein n=1 Tax=Carnegiea gigantea TaxID=171969 RepID=A0A9Q1QMJ8_9CARY|nr:hypothetical protein Cgig2_025137 [Carnegiea gigantea]
MFTPQRKAPWTPATSAPRTEPRASASRFGNSTDASLKGKAVAFIDGPPPPPPPPLGSLAFDTVGRGVDSGNLDDWRSFKEAGLLDESAMERKDREALLEKVSRLEKELFDYQYNMGLLLIEKNNLVSKNEELGQVVAESQEILKREQTAHLIVISEAEKREENLRKALDIEKKCIADPNVHDMGGFSSLSYVQYEYTVRVDHLVEHLHRYGFMILILERAPFPRLERALRDMHEEHSKIKDTSKTTVADINAEMEVLEMKRVELEAKSQSVNAKLAEVDRKTSELNRKLKDIEARESILKMERLTLIQERELHESYFRKQKEDLLEWERKLQEAEQRLCDSRSTLNEREEKLHETEKISKDKEIKLAELQQKIDFANATLKKMEDDINNQSTELSLKEKKAEAMRCDIEMREKLLKEKEERLNAREEVELQKLLSEQKAILDTKMHEFELEINQKRKCFEVELESRKQAVAQRETEINHLEAKLGKREQALEKKLERVKEKERDVDVKFKGLKEQEKCLKAEEKRLHAEREQLKADIERLEDLKEEIETLKADLRKQELQIEEERKKLGNLEVERSEYLRLQLNLKQEMENVRHQNKLIEKEVEDLKLQREKFEKDWEALDEKRAAVDNELKRLAEEKACFEKLLNSEEERLKKKKTEVEEYIRQETESIRLDKESFEATLKHEKLMLSQKAENERSLMHQDYERWRENLEIDMQKRQKEWEKLVQEKESAFEEMRSREMKTINHLKEDAKKKKEEMENERHCMKKERQEIELNKKQLEETSIDISKDIAALDNLSKKLKSQREQLISERAYFVAFVEKIKSCKSCGDSALEFLHRDLGLEGSSDLPRHSRLDQEVAEDEHSPFGEFSKKTFSTGINKDSPEFGGQMNIIRKCASLIFHLSPKSRRPDDHSGGESTHPAAPRHADENEGADTSMLRSDGVVAVAQISANDEPRTSLGLENGLKNLQPDIIREGNVDNALSIDDSNIDSEAQGIQESEVSDLKSGWRKPGRKRGAGVHRTRTIKAAVEDANAFLGETSKGKKAEQLKNSAHDKAHSLETVHADMVTATSARKRTRSQASRMTESEQDIDNSEGKADSVTTDGRRKRRQTAASTLATPGQRRYNLRHHTAAATASKGQQSPSGNTKNDGGLAHGDNKRPALNPDDAPAQSLDITVDSGRKLNVAQVSTAGSGELFSDKIAKAGTAKVVDSNVDAAKSVENTNGK